MRASLNLAIKGKWFDMIASGAKREECRDCEHPQVERFWLWTINADHWGYRRHFAVFRNGYSMTSRALAVEIVGIGLRGKGEVRHPEWGEPRGNRQHIAIELGRVLKVCDSYRALKEWIDNSSDLRGWVNRANLANETEGRT